jgi:hypothetical protein
MKRLLVIASLFLIAGLATAGMAINHNNPVPNMNNPVPPCIPTGCGQ